jgi:nitrogen fixation protein FixH
MHIFELSIEQNSTSISVTIPEELSHFKGNMTLFHPAYAILDQTYPIESNTQHKQFIPVQRLKKGRWLVKIDGENEGKNYYHEAYLLAP